MEVIDIVKNAKVKLRTTENAYPQMLPVNSMHANLPRFGKKSFAGVIDNETGHPHVSGERFRSDI